MPDLAIASATPVEGGHAVRVVVANRALLPTISAWAQRYRLLPPDELALGSATILAATDVLPGRPPAPLPVREGRARLESGIRGESTRTIDLYVAPGTSPASVTLSSRLGGVLSSPVR